MSAKLTPGTGHQGEIANLFLRSLPLSSREAILPGLDRVHFQPGRAMGSPDHPLRSILFVTEGLVSLMKVMRDGRSVEVGAVGVEGVIDPVAIAEASGGTVDTVAWTAGSGLAIARGAFEQLMRDDRALERAVHRYAHFAFAQCAQAAACNRLHSLEQRMCRSLLVAGDNGGTPLRVTHEMLGAALGAPRSSVSLVAKKLQHAGLIDYHRGAMRIADRQALEAATCECYAEARARIEQNFGGAPGPSSLPARARQKV